MYTATNILQSIFYEGGRLVSDHQSVDKVFVLCIDGPSGAGKNTTVNHINDMIKGNLFSVLDTNNFLKKRCDRRDDEKKSLFENWYRVDYFKKKLSDFLSSNNLITIENAYKHDNEGDISHLVKIHMNKNRALVGRYALHNEIQTLIADRLFYKKKIIIDAPLELRIDRIRKRACIQKHREVGNQDKLILETVEPDWCRYFPTIFMKSDLYMVNYSNKYSDCRKPEECVNRDHIWGAYADLHIQNEKIYRMIEIGENGSTSLHMHENLDEIYYHVLGGPLGVILSDGYDEVAYVLTPGQSISISHGIYHKAFALTSDSPLYYENIFSVNGKDIDINDIKKIKNAKPMRGSLRYLLSQ